MEKKKYYVYVHFRKDTMMPFYVGKGTGKRVGVRSRRSPHWHNIVAKHGYERDIVKYFDKSVDAYSYEISLIASLRKYGIVNVSDGGEGGSGYVYTDEDRAKMSLAMRGNSNAKGCVRSAEHIEKIKNIAKTRVITSQTRQLMREAKLGTHRSEAVKAKISATLKAK